MGVRGLQTFIRDNQSSLCRTLQLPQEDTDSSPPQDRTPIVVDAWGIIFSLYLDALPWVSGGEYLRFHRLVRRLVLAWRSVGLEPTFVFDGPGPPSKHSTALERLSRTLSTSLLFHTTSPTSRSASSFARSCPAVILPPFTSHTFIHALHSLSVATHFVPLGEADGACVVLADQLGGYVIGQDTDFAVLSCRGMDGVKGYVPLDMMFWIEGEECTPNRASGSGSNDGWTTTSSPRTSSFSKRQPALLPPSEYSSPTLVLTYLTPLALPTRLRLPPTLIPLFASLAGNDYVPPSYASHLFEPTLSPTQKIEKVARVLREVALSFRRDREAAGSSGKGKEAEKGDQAVELVRRAIKGMLVRPRGGGDGLGLVSEQRLEEMVETIIEATFAYTLDPLEACCEVYPFCGGLDGGCPSSSSSWGDGEEGPAATATGAERFAMARRKGWIGSVCHAYLYPGRIYLWTQLEDPNDVSWKCTEASRDIRAKAYAYAEEGLGGFRWDEEDGEDEELAEGKDPGDDASTVNSAAAEDVRGEDGERIEDERELRHLLGVASTATPSSEEEGTTLVSSTPADETSSTVPSPTMTALSRVVVEYLRPSSSTNSIQPVPLPLPPASTSTSTTPLVLQPLQVRLEAYLSALGSLTPSILALPRALHPLVAALRVCVRTSGERWRTNGGGGGREGRWKWDEVIAVLKAGIGCWAAFKVGEPKGREGGGDGGGRGGRMYPLLTTRNCHLLAQLGAALTDAHLVAQALLLLPEEGDGDGDGEKREDEMLTHLTPWVFVSGTILHTLLSESEEGGKAGGRDPREGGGSEVWKWGEEEEAVLARCVAGVMDGMVGGGRGWIVGAPSLDTDAEKGEDEETEEDLAGRLDKMIVGDPDVKGDDEDTQAGEAKKKKQKKKKHAKNGVAEGLPTPAARGRFGVLSELGAES